MVKKYKSLILYGIFGIATTLVNIIAYFISAKIGNLSVVLSTCIAWLIAVIFAYVTNKIWVFESKTTKLKDVSKEIFSFFSCRILTGLLDLLIMYIFVDKLYFNDLLFKVLSNVIVIVLNYVASKLIIFKKKDNNENKDIKNIKCDWEEILTIVVIFGLATLFSMNSPSNILFSGESYTDSSVFRLMGMMMVKGYTPYLDMFDHKGPIIYILNCLGFIINKDWGIWLIELIFLFISFYFIYKIAKFKNKRIPALIVLLYATVNLFDYFQGGNFTEEYALMFILVSLYIFIDYLLNNKTSNLKIIICGICFACVCLLRINMIPCWIVFCLTILIKCLKSKEYKELLNYIINFLIGCLIIIGPIFAWLICKGAFNDFIFDYIIFNLKYTGNGELANVWHNIFNFSNSTILIIGVLTNIYAIFKEKNKTIYIANLAFTLVTLLVVVISGRYYLHYAMILIPVFVIPFSYFINMLFKDKNIEISAVVIIYLLSVLVVPQWHALLEKTGRYINCKINNIGTIADNILTIKKVVEENTELNDKISVYGNWDQVYLSANRLPSSKYSYQFPISDIMPQLLENYFNEISKSKPKVIIVQNNYNDDKIQQFIKKYNYHEILKIENDFYIFKLSDKN